MMKKSLSPALGCALALCSANAAAEIGDVSINGFLTTAFTVTDAKTANTPATNTTTGNSSVGKNTEYLHGTANSVMNFDNMDNRLGIQITADVSDNVSLTAQLMAKGDHDKYNLGADWAYASVGLGDFGDLRFGKVKVPQFLVSDYQAVGYAYPWLRPPVEVYSANPINSLNGVDMLFYWNPGGVNINLQLYTGSGTHVTNLGAQVYDKVFSQMASSFCATSTQYTPYTDVNSNGFYDLGDTLISLTPPAPPAQPTAAQMQAYALLDYSGQYCNGQLSPQKHATVDFNTYKMTGINFSVGTDDFNFRIGYFATMVDAAAFNMKEEFGSFGGLGFSMDKADVVIFSEYITRDTADTDTMKMAFPDQNAWYFTLGYRMGPVLPFLTFADIDNGKDDAEHSQMQGSNFAVRQSSTTFGMRFDIADGTDFKFEITQATPKKDAAGNPTYGLFDSPVDSAMIYGMSLDVIF